MPALIAKFMAWFLNDDGTISSAAIRGFIPAGFYMDSATLLSANTDWLLCDGSTVSQADFPELYAAIGGTYGTASAGYFKLPDCRARFRLAVGSLTSGALVALGRTGGEESHVLTEAEGALGAHTHGVGNAKVVSPLIGELQLTELYGTTGITEQPVFGFGPVPVPTDPEASTITEVNLGTTPPMSETDAVGHNTMPPYIGCYTYIKS
jgi:hypothetical protein